MKKLTIAILTATLLLTIPSLAFAETRPGFSLKIVKEKIKQKEVTSAVVRITGLNAPGYKKVKYFVLNIRNLNPGVIKLVRLDSDVVISRHNNVSTISIMIYPDKIKNGVFEKTIGLKGLKLGRYKAQCTLLPVFTIIDTTAVIERPWPDFDNIRPPVKGPLPPEKKKVKAKKPKPKIQNKREIKEIKSEIAGLDDKIKENNKTISKFKDLIKNKPNSNLVGLWKDQINIFQREIDKYTSDKNKLEQRLKKLTGK